MAKIIITGSSGFIGNALTKHLSKKGHFIYAFQRNTTTDAPNNVELVYYDLSHLPSSHYFEKADYCIHTAYDKSYSSSEDLNLNASKNLFELCQKQGVKYIFLSSLSAQSHVDSYYGKSKLSIENLVKNPFGCTLKLGLVIGKGGLFHRMKTFIKNSPIIPVFGGGRQAVQYISISDVLDVCEHLIHHFHPDTFVIIHPTSIENKEIYVRLAKQMHKKRLFLPMPTQFTIGVLSLLEFLGLKLAITSDNLKGLRQMKTIEQRLPIDYSGKKFKPFEEALHFVD